VSARRKPIRADEGRSFIVLREYIPILVLLVVVAGFVAFSLIVTHLFGPRRHGRVKLEPYESGMPPLGDAHRRISVKYYLIAMFFIIFDVEVIFLYPWAAMFRDSVKEHPFLLIEMFIFLFVLLVGLIYIWRKGGLEWD
jgi:NADH-quinone oxidoreductase subunit A